MDTVNRVIQLKPIVKYNPGRDFDHPRDQAMQQRMRDAGFAPGDFGLFDEGGKLKRMPAELFGGMEPHIFLRQALRRAMQQEVDFMALSLDDLLHDARFAPPVANQRVEKF